jgi:hypothetical protein
VVQEDEVAALGEGGDDGGDGGDVVGINNRADVVPKDRRDESGDLILELEMYI